MAVNITRPTTSQAPSRRMAPHPLMTLRDEIDRMFDNVFGASFGRMMPGMFTPDAPRIDVCETDSAYEITAELPGVNEKDVEVTLAHGLLTISGEKKAERDESHGDWHLSERTYGSFRRSFQVPEAVDEDKIQAKFERGVLTLSLPKTAPKEARRIAIGGTAPDSSRQTPHTERT